MIDPNTLFGIADRAKALNLPVDRITLVIGIVGHMDRSSYPGTVGDCFVPRVAS